jgi:hypothetical protein
MTRNELVTLLKARLGSWNNADLDNQIYLEIQATQRRLERAAFLPWFLFVDDTTSLLTSTGIETVALPDDFLRLPSDAENESLFYYSTVSTQTDAWVPIVRSTYKLMRERRNGSGVPTFFDMFGDKIYLRYIPDDIYQLRLMYYAKGVLLDSDIENVWLKYADDLILAETGFVVTSEHLKIPELAATFAQQIQTATRRLQTETVAREEASRRRDMGDD